MRKSHNLKILVFALLMSIFLFGVEANAAWQEEWDRTVKAAKQEGQLRIWGGEEVSHPTIITAFNREHPDIKVITVTGRASQLVLRVIAERRAGKYLADVWATGPGGPRTLYL